MSTSNEKYRVNKDKDAMEKLDEVVLWFGTEKTKEILEDYNEDFVGLRKIGLKG